MSTALPAGPSGRFPGLDRMRPALFLDRQQPVLWLMTVLSLHVIVWTYFGTATHGVIHHDMAEAWAWGQEFELGYSKHPPLFAWVTALWFKLLPRENWSFFLLSSINSALGLAGAWTVAGRLLPRTSQWAALFLLMLTPFYGILALKFNANAVLLPLWPWAVYFFIRALETRSVMHGTLFGAFAGLAVLGKYYSVLLLASCFIAALLHPKARAVFRSPAPYAALVACAGVLAPHALWAMDHEFTTINYAASKMHYPVGAVLARGADAMLQVAAFHVLVIAAVLLAFASVRGQLPSRLWVSARARRNWWLVALALGPLALTLLACVVDNVRISAQFMIPIFFMVPTVVLALCHLLVTRSRLRVLLMAAAGATTAAAVAAAPIGVLARKAGIESWHEPRRAIALEATRLWHDAFGRPVQIVSGEPRLSQGATFYSPDSPSDFTDFDFRRAPWITPERIARSGMIVLCPSEKAACLDMATRYEVAGSRRYERSYVVDANDRNGAKRHITIVLIAPHDPASMTDEPD